MVAPKPGDVWEYQSAWNIGVVVLYVISAREGARHDTTCKCITLSQPIPYYNQTTWYWPDDRFKLLYRGGITDIEKLVWGVI